MTPSPANVTAYKTAVFAIHNPSRRGRAMLADALTRNHLAYSKLLRTLLPRVDLFAQARRGKKREREIAKVAALIVRPLPLSIGAKAGLISDVAGQVSSHIELRARQAGPSAPTAAPLTVTEADRSIALREFAAAVDLESENSARDRLLAQARAGRRRPILFLKNRISDGYLLLYCPAKQRYFAWLNLHPKGSRFASPVTVEDLVDVRTGQIMSFTSRTGALFPLAFGRDFQLAEFIRKARPQSAKLLQSEQDRFDLHVTFEYDTPAIAPVAYVGVDRGIYNLASLCVVDATGAIIDQRNIDGRSLRYVQRLEERRQRAAQRRGRHYRSRARRHFADEAVHVAANEIVAFAAEHRAQVVVESLAQFAQTGRKRARSNFNRVLNRRQYQKLERALDYKLAAVGLPRYLEVSAAYTSQTCPRCGHCDRENRPKRPEVDGFRLERFACTRCGYESDADLNAARVIALKRLWRQGLPESQRRKLMRELTPEHGFEQFLRDRAAMRGDGPCDREVDSSEGRGLVGAAPHTEEKSEGNAAMARTPRRKKKPAAMLPQLSSSSEIPPPSPEDHPASTTSKGHIR